MFYLFFVVAIRDQRKHTIIFCSMEKLIFVFISVVTCGFFI